MSLHGFGQGRRRQTAAIKPWLFQVHRVWKGLIESCDPSEGGLSPPLSLPLTSLFLVGGRRRVSGRRRRSHVTHVSCWADQNGIWTKTHHLLLPASGCVSRDQRTTVPRQKSNTLPTSLIPERVTKESVRGPFHVSDYSLKAHYSNYLCFALWLTHNPPFSECNCIQSDRDLSLLWYGGDKADHPLVSLAAGRLLFPIWSICLRTFPLRSLLALTHLIKTREGEEAPLQSFSHMAEGQVHFSFLKLPRLILAKPLCNGR